MRRTFSEDFQKRLNSASADVEQFRVIARNTVVSDSYKIRALSGAVNALSRKLDLILEQLKNQLQ